MNSMVIGGAISLAIVVGAFQTGRNVERNRGENATLRATIAAMELDKTIARKAEADATARANALESKASEEGKKLDALVAEIAKRPAARRCGLTDDDVRRLRELG